MSQKAHAFLFCRVCGGILLFALFAGPVLGAREAGADGVAKPAPTQIDADHMEYDLPSRTAVFTGNVHVFDDAMDMRSQKMDVTFDEQNQVRRVDARGEVRIARAAQMATAATASYDVAAGQVELAGQPALEMPQGKVAGAEKLFYDTAGQRFRTDGGRPHLKVEGQDNQRQFDLLGEVAPAEPAAAAPKAAAPPTDIIADVMTYDVRAQQAVFSGNVQIVDHQFGVQADTITAHLAAGGKINRIVAAGNVKVTREDSQATAAQAVYDVEAGEIRLTGSPELVQGSTRISGMEWVTYVKRLGKYNFGGGRIRTQFITEGDGALLDAIPGGTETE